MIRFEPQPLYIISLHYPHRIVQSLSWCLTFMTVKQVCVRRFVFYAGSCLSAFTVSSLSGYPTLDARTADRPGLSALSTLRESNPRKRFCRASPDRSVKCTLLRHPPPMRDSNPHTRFIRSSAIELNQLWVFSALRGRPSHTHSVLTLNPVPSPAICSGQSVEESRSDNIRDHRFGRNSGDDV